MHNNANQLMPIGEAVSRFVEKGNRTVVDLIGLAVDSTIPRTTTGTDYFCAVRIIDGSHPTGIRIHFFFKSMEDLPLIRNVGDVVVVSNVKMSIYKNVHKPEENYVYALFNKKSPRLALIEGGSSSTHCVPYRISPNYRLSREQMMSIAELARYPLADRIEDIFETVSMGEIEVNKELNLICKILYIAQVDVDVDVSKKMLFIWNGTYTPPLHINTELEDEDKSPLPLELELVPEDILCAYPNVGSVMPIFVDEGKLNLGVHVLEVGKWMKLIKISFRTYSGLWYGVLTHESKFYYYPDAHYTAILYESSSSERGNNWRESAMSSPLFHPITAIVRPNAPVVTLMYVIQCQEVPVKFSCVVRVVSVFRCRGKEIKGMRLTLEDPTARLHANLLGENAKKFFKNYKSEDALEMKMNEVVGVGVGVVDGSRNPPLFRCCLVSYYNRWGRKNYGIYDTWLN